MSTGSRQTVGIYYDKSGPGFDGRGDQATRQHLHPPTVDHDLEDSILGAEQPDVLVAQPPHEPRHSIHPATSPSRSPASNAEDLQRSAPELDPGAVALPPTRPGHRGAGSQSCCIVARRELLHLMQLPLY